MMSSGFGLIFLLLFSGGTEIPQDALALVEPAAGLEILQEKTEPANLEKLILSALEEDAAPVQGKISKAGESAIQNLASKNAKVRSRARAQLVTEGRKAIPRLRDVVANDERRAEEAKRAIAEIEGAAKAERHGESVAQIFAIRLAARKKLTQLVPALKKAAGAENPFVRLAAEDSLVRLDKTFQPSGETAGAAARTVDLEALPTSARLFLALRVPQQPPGKGEPLTVQGFMEKMVASLPVGAPSLEQKEEEIRTAHETIVNFVKSYGNMRPRRAVLVNAGTISERAGGLGILVQGLYEPGVIKKTLNDSPLWTSTEVSGFTLYNSVFLRLVLLSDSSVLILPTIASSQFPVKEYLKNLAAGKKPLRKDKRLSRFVDSLDDPMLVRGLVINDDKLLSEEARAEMENEFQREMPEDAFEALKNLKEIELTVAPLQGDEKKQRVRFEGAFSRAKSAEVFAEYFRGLIDQGVAELENLAQAGLVPFAGLLETMTDILKSIKLSAEGKKAILRVELPEFDLEKILGGVIVGN